MTTANKVRTARPSSAAKLYWALQELVRTYQFRDKDRICGYGLTVNECYALECLVRSGPMMLNDLARLLYSDKSTVSRVVASLEAKGHSRRVTDAVDGRAIRLSATAAGEKLHKQIMRAIVAEQNRILCDLPAAVRRGLPVALTKLAESAAARCGSGAECGGQSQAGTIGACAPAKPTRALAASSAGPLSGRLSGPQSGRRSGSGARRGGKR
jgi:MarR family transcriptional regulator, 2-MHQ and catechol-resistance regulon repressor